MKAKVFNRFTKKARLIECPSCYGGGTMGMTDIECRRCRGEGQLKARGNADAIRETKTKLYQSMKEKAWRTL